MNFASLIGPAVVAAGVSGIVSIAGLIISTWTARATHTEKLASDREQAQRKADADIALAERKLTLDRAFAAWKRRTEFAEEVLADFYQARDIITAARSPGGFADEGNTRKKEEWEGIDDTRILNSYFRTIERLNKSSEFFAQLYARRHRFVALFGQHAIVPYDELFRIRGEIIIAVQMLTTTLRQKHADPSWPDSLLSRSSDENLKMWKTTVGWPYGENDPIEARLNQIIENIEKFCLPVIQRVTQ